MSETEIVGFCVCDEGPDRPAPDCGIPSHRAEGLAQRGRHPMTVTDRTAATDAEFRSRIAPFESAPTPPEVREARVAEEVARALPESVGYPWPEGDGAWSQHEREHYRTLAAAAVAAYRAAQDGGAEHGPGKCVPMEDANRALYVAGDAEMQLEALSAQDGGTEGAVRRVEALAAEYERTPPGTVTRDRDVALDLRAALAPQAGDGAR